MKRWLICIFAVLFSACVPVSSGAESAHQEVYPDLGAAPEWVGDTWFNTETPLKLSELRGKVVLVDMWTFG